MLYVSTRGKADIVSSAYAISRGLAADGGLFVPQQLPSLRPEDIEEFSRLPYTELATEILSLYLTDYTKDEVRSAVTAAYRPQKFGGARPAPLVQAAPHTGVLELWHGPTCAFKDMALQLLPHLLNMARKKLGQEQKVAILVATSGDTGKAALEGFADVEGTEIIVFYPAEGVSLLQKRQMETQKGSNVHVFGIRGNFDDAQRGVKQLFGDRSLAETLNERGYVLSSANSINWGRLVPQIVYYFSAYAQAVLAGQVKQGRPVNFAVPTGNFGDILAGYYAKLMGLPIARLLCASNSNNVLTDFIDTGIYDKKRDFYRTMSPSMDILVSSNLERLLFDACGRNGEQVTGYMEKLAAGGSYQIEREILQQIRRHFFAAWVDEVETEETIDKVKSEHAYLLDTHTAVAWRALEKYRILTDDTTYSIVLSTASPYKFPDSVLRALGEDTEPQADPFALLKKLEEASGTAAPAKLAALRELPVLHKEVIDAQGMEEAVLNVLR